MSRSDKNSQMLNSGSYLEVKSKLDAEFRRFLLNSEKTSSFEAFVDVLKNLHHLGNHPFTVWYTDHEGDLLPINNNDNYACAVRHYLKSKRLFKLSLLKNAGEMGTLTSTRSNLLNSSITSGLSTFRKVNPPTHPMISFPEDFRRVSAIIDIDIVPETCRRVKLMKSVGTDRPLGFYIRDGVSIRVTVDGMEKVPGVFISRLMAGGLAESTGLLAVNDEILEVNGIEVAGKSLDQVTDMMVANSNNLIITVKPVNQHNNITPRKQQQQQQLQQQQGNVAAKMKHKRNASANSSLLHKLQEVDEDGAEDNNNNLNNNTMHNGANRHGSLNGSHGDKNGKSEKNHQVESAAGGVVVSNSALNQVVASTSRKVEILEL